MTEETSTQTYRLFVAISLPEGVKTGIEQAQGELQRALPEACVRWTKREQFHLTLKFLGNVAAQRLEALTEALRRDCSNFPALQLRAERIGFFPEGRSPRVIWLGVHAAGEELSVLQTAVESAAAGFTREESEERFAGHVTLGRVKSINRAQADRLAELARGMADRFFGEWTAREVQILRSELSPQGARHTALASVPLAGDSVAGNPPG